jgi:hypothetical protein
LTVDASTDEVQSVMLTEASVDDVAVVPEMLAQVQEPSEQVSADGAYDKDRVYAACAAH